jgi:hypothetical protein
MGEVALGFSSRAAAATATGMNARDPETEDVDLRSGIEKAVLLAAMLTRLAATRDGAAMFTSETADMSAIGWTKFASTMAPLEVRLEGDDIRESYWSSRYSPVIYRHLFGPHTHGHHARRDRAHLRPRRVGVAYPSSLGPSVIEGIEPPHSRRRPAQGQGG